MSSKESSDLIQASRRFFGYALSHDAHDLYERASRPKPVELGTRVTEYLVREATATQLLANRELREVGELFSAAIDNTQTILMQQARSRTLPPEFIPLIARDQRTIITIARMAMHSDGFMQTAITPLASKKYFNLSEDASHIEVTDNLVDTVSGGCPFAVTSDRTVKPDPIFRKTVHLAGDLIYLAHKK